jgi:hypothetical protein
MQTTILKKNQRELLALLRYKFGINFFMTGDDCLKNLITLKKNKKIVKIQNDLKNLKKAVNFLMEDKKWVTNVIKKPDANKIANLFNELNN